MQKNISLHKNRLIFSLRESHILNHKNHIRNEVECRIKEILSQKMRRQIFEQSEDKQIIKQQYQGNEKICKSLEEVLSSKTMSNYDLQIALFQSIEVFHLRDSPLTQMEFQTQIVSDKIIREIINLLFLKQYQNILQNMLYYLAVVAYYDQQPFRYSYEMEKNNIFDLIRLQLTLRAHKSSSLLILLGNLALNLSSDSLWQSGIPQQLQFQIEICLTSQFKDKSQSTDELLWQHQLYRCFIILIRSIKKQDTLQYFRNANSFDILIEIGYKQSKSQSELFVECLETFRFLFRIGDIVSKGEYGNPYKIKFMYSNGVGMMSGQRGKEFIQMQQLI